MISIVFCITIVTIDTRKEFLKNIYERNKHHTDLALLRCRNFEEISESKRKT